MIIEKSIYLGSGKRLSICNMPNEIGVLISEGSASLTREEACFLIEELNNFVNNK